MGAHFKTIPATTEYPDEATLQMDPAVLLLEATQELQPGSHMTTVTPSEAKVPD